MDKCDKYTYQNYMKNHLTLPSNLESKPDIIRAVKHLITTLKIIPKYKKTVIQKYTLQKPRNEDIGAAVMESIKEMWKCKLAGQDVREIVILSYI